MGLYSDAASFGRTAALISAIISTIIALIIIGVGIYMYMNQSKFPGTNPPVTILFGIVFLILTWITYWIIESSDFLSAAYGTEEVIDLVSGPPRKY